MTTEEGRVCRRAVMMTAAYGSTLLNRNVYCVVWFKRSIENKVPTSFSPCFDVYLLSLLFLGII